MQENPVVSVIIPTYNSAVYVLHAIQSLVQQTFQPIEIIVIDDGSTDNTVALLHELKSQYNFQLFCQSNQGPAAARNRGLGMAQAKYICFLDADDRLLPTSIQERVEKLEAHPDIDLIFNDVYRIDQKNERGYAFLAQHQFLLKFQSAIHSQEKDFIIFNERYFDCAMQFFPFIWTSSVMVRASVVQTAGLFNTKWRGPDDIEYWLRIAEKGKIAYLNRVLTEWHHYYSNITKFGNYRFYDDAIDCYAHFKAQLSENRKYLKRAINKRLSHYAFAGGYEALAAESLRHARQFFIKACYFQPSLLKNWIYLFLSLLPSTLFYKLRRLKQVSER